MYEEFYGLKTKPFQVTPDPSFLYWSEGHRMTYTMLQYGIISGSPVTVITGEVGTGKTTLVRQLLRDLPAELEAGLISNLQAGKGELLEWALMAFGKPYDGGHVQRFERFQDFLVERYAVGKQVALIIDEAQNLGVEQLEELRMLSNINADQDTILRLILVGQPELRELLGRPELRQFAQRVTSDFHMKPMSRQDVHAYIQRRLEVAGAGHTIFPAGTCELIAHATRGIPRLVNVLCDLCLVYGFSEDRDLIEEDIVRDLMADVERNGIFKQFASVGVQPRLAPGSPGNPPSARHPGPDEQAKDRSHPTRTGRFGKQLD